MFSRLGRLGKLCRPISTINMLKKMQNNTIPTTEKLPHSQLPLDMKVKQYRAIPILFWGAILTGFCLSNYGTIKSRKGKNDKTIPVDDNKDSSFTDNIMKQINKGVDKEFQFKSANNMKERLSDVKGIQEINDEIFDVIDILKNRAKYIERGAKLPKGVLLVGPPGTGKTLLARAIAGEAGVNFIYTSGSSFDEMFVGMGARRIRKLFSSAREKAPCIIFIDEIDTLLSNSRRSGLEHSSSSATINQFLSELDGFDQTQNIMLIGATNNVEQLDPASIRPGRFDIKINIPMPDLKGREEILDYYVKKIVTDMKIDVKKLSYITTGFSGAELANLVNFAAIYSVKTSNKVVTMEDFEKACDRIKMGITNKRIMTLPDKLKTSLHETGHTLACYYLRGPDRLYKTTIIPRGHSLGATYMLPNESELISMSKEQLLSVIDVSLGGYCAEKIVMGEQNVTTGCSSDLENATSIANKLIRQFGMASKEIGLSVSDKFDTSDSSNSKIEEIVNRLLSVNR